MIKKITTPTMQIEAKIIWWVNKYLPTQSSVPGRLLASRYGGGKQQRGNGFSTMARNEVTMVTVLAARHLGFPTRSIFKFLTSCPFVYGW